MVSSILNDFDFAVVATKNKSVNRIATIKMLSRKINVFCADVFILYAT
jgi:hypothetical protein